MRLLLVSDIHGSSDAVEQLAEEAVGADLVVLAGDITHFGDVSDAAEVIERLRNHNPRLLAVAGNCDNRQIKEYLARESLLLDYKGAAIGGILFLGLSGALPGPVSTPYELSEEELAELLAKTQHGPECTVLISHQPPYKTIADRAMKVKHVGSRSVRDWIDRNSPQLVVCGHIHESFGSSRQDGSLIVNPGALKDGRYAVAEINPADCSVEVELKAVSRQPG